MMDFILKLVPTTVGDWAIIGAIVVLIGLAIKYIPAWIDAALASGIDAIFAKLGPDEDWLFVQFLIYLERKYGTDANEQKAKEAVDKLLAMLPIQYRVFAGDKVKAKLYELVSTVFEKVKARVEQEAKEHTLPAA